MIEAPHWPVVTLDVQEMPELDHEGPSSWDDDGMQVTLPTGGRVEVVWPFDIRLSLQTRPNPECIVQPHLTTAAASIALHHGRQPFHAGAFAIDGAAWAVLGAKEAGKSTTVALADQLGSVIITDDLLVIEDGMALAGPRCIDLRTEAAQALQVGEDLGVVGRRERWRIRVAACPPSVPMGGFIVPSWGTDEIRVLPPVVRLQSLCSNSALQGVTINDPEQYLRLASLPMVSWSRPRSWTTAIRSFDILCTEIAHLRRKDRE
jgi:hypothetical protein